jgi:Actinobacteria/chloroflexi VLRF1 release factor
MKNPAAGGGRWVEVPPERLVSWIITFAERHGGTADAPLTAGWSGTTVTFTAADGATAECHPPFPPAPPVSPAGPGPAGPEPTAAVRAAAEALAAHAAADRTVGVLLVRLGGYAAGVFSGSPPVLVASKTGSRPVHGRSAAGGWSQQRFARRRENQAATALRAAADAAAEVFGRYGADRLDAVVLGGDKRAAAGLRELRGLRADARLEKYLAKATERFLTVPDPRLAVLRDIPRAYLATRIRLTEPESDGPPQR